MPSIYPKDINTGGAAIPITLTSSIYTLTQVYNTGTLGIVGFNASDLKSLIVTSTDSVDRILQLAVVNSTNTVSYLLGTFTVLANSASDLLQSTQIPLLTDSDGSKFLRMNTQPNAFSLLL